MNSVYIGVGFAVNIVHSYTIVKLRFLLVAEMTEAIPLTATLRVERPGIVIYGSGRLRVNVFVEYLAAKEGNVTLCVHRPVERDSCAGLDFIGRF